MWFDIETDEQRPTRRNVVISEAGEKRRANVLKVETSRLEVRKKLFECPGGIGLEQYPGRSSRKKN